MHVVLRCAEPLARRARWILDSLLLPAGITPAYVESPPAEGPWLLYASVREGERGFDRAVSLAHVPAAWEVFRRGELAASAPVDAALQLPLPLPQRLEGFDGADDIGVDLVANAFYFLSSWSERAPSAGTERATWATSVFARLGVPQDIVDRYQVRLIERLRRLRARLGAPEVVTPGWPGGATYAVVLSHDVDFVPGNLRDQALQGVKSLARSLVKHRDVRDTLRVGGGLARALATATDPYGCIPAIIARERALGVRSSFQVAVGHRHPADVNYHVEDDATRDYLRTIVDAGFDLCLHGSYRSAEDSAWYAQEVELLSDRLGRPVGSRQHFLSFAYDALFSAQEAAGIQFDMSMGFPDRPGPRAGYSFPYFPYSLAQERPYDVLQISLFLMDVTLRGYMDLSPEAASGEVDRTLADLRAKGGAASVVWHPIVFGGARDPGFDDVYWRLVERVQATGGACLDGTTLNRAWRERTGAPAGRPSPAPSRPGR